MIDILDNDITSEWEEQVRINSQRIKFPVVVSGDSDLDVPLDFQEPKIEIKNTEEKKIDKKTVTVVDLGGRKKTNKGKLF